MPNNPWTEEEISLLKARKKIPNRSKRSIRRKQILLGLKKVKFKIRFKNKKLWTKEEIELLKTNPNKITWRSKDSVRRKMLNLGLVSTKKGFRVPWKKKEEKILKDLIKQKKTPKQIFELRVLRFTRNAIQKKMSSLGFFKPIKQEKLTKDCIRNLEKFLLNNWKDKTIEDLLFLWNNNNSVKINKNKVNYHLRKLKIKISHCEILKTKELRKKEEEIKKLSHKTLKSLEETIRLQRVKIMQERLSNNKDMWTGLKNSMCEVDENE